MVRLQSIIADCRPTLVLTTPELASSADRLVGLVPELGRMRWLATNQIAQATAGNWTWPSLRPRTIALLQYTSGSTAAPKGVMVSHGNLLHNLGLIEKLTGAAEKDLSVIWLPPYHDMGLIGGILQPLYTGFSAVLMSPAAFIQRPARWLEAITRYQATISGGPNFAYELCVHGVTQKDREQLDLSSWRLAFNGAEPVRHETIESFSAAFGSQGFRREVFYPCYGLAEATLMVTGSRSSEPAHVLAVNPGLLATHRVERSSGPTATLLVGCGRSAAEQEIRIVDPESLHQCPPGTIGEIWVRGPSVALGYWGHQEETAAVFGAHLAESEEAPFLRTGDLGLLEAGELYVTGRIKELIIIRGRNHYPHDIEQTAVRAHPALRPGCSAAFGVERDGEERLVIVQEIGRHAARSQAEDIAAAVRLAVAMEHELRVDAVVLVPQGAVPKTSSGKIQRLACRTSYVAGTLSVLAVSAADEETALSAEGGAGGEGDLGGAVAALDPSRHHDEVEAWLRSQVALAMDAPVARVDRRPLAALGLDSLRASRLSGVIQSVLGVHIAPVRLLDGMGIETLTADVLAALAAPRGGPDLAQSSEPGVPCDETTPPPLSPMQEAIWFLQRLYAGSAAYNLPIRLRITGPLDAAVLQAALEAFLRRHGALRTVFPVLDGRPVQWVEEAVSLRLGETDLSGFRPEHQEVEVARVIRETAAAPFDLTAGPLLRARLIRLRQDECLLLLVTHHLVADGASGDLLVKELSSLYDALVRGLPGWLPLLPMQYADWARQRREWLGSAEAAVQLSWWCEQLRGIPVLNFPTDGARPARPTHQGATYDFEISSELAEGLGALARDEGASLFMVLLAAFQLLLARWTDEFDVAVGVPVSLRGGADTAGLVGLFVNTIVLRGRVDPHAGFRILLRRARASALDAYARRDLPFERIIERLQPERDLSRNPLFQVMLAFQGASIDPVEAAGVTFTPEPVHAGGSVVDLTLHVWERRSGALACSMEYATDLFEAPTIQRLAGGFVALLEAIAAEPDRPLSCLPLLPAAERRQVLVECNQSARHYPLEWMVHQLITGAAARAPESIALTWDGGQLTYGELEQRSNQLARYLCRLTVGPEVRVGVCMERSPELIVTLLAVLKAGGAYMPLDPEYPIGRLNYMLADSGARVLITNLVRERRPHAQTVCEIVALDEPATAAAVAVESSAPQVVGSCSTNLAYVIYTSGSTGTPKGIMIPHGALTNHMLWMQDAFPLDPSDSVLQKTPMTFDAAGWEFFAPLMAGARLVLPPSGSHRDPTALARAVVTHGVTILQLVPSQVPTVTGALAEARARAPGRWRLRRLFCGGEMLSAATVAESARRLPGVSLYNLYGPAEATIDATSWSCEPVQKDLDAAVPIGLPIANTSCYVLDAQLQAVALGVPGELFIGGAGLARGYLDRPALTASRFLPDPFAAEPGGRLYRTGDRVRRRSDGVLEFLGRLDHQVKIRGSRIELGEVEAELRTHRGVREAVVVARESRPGDLRLIGYVVPDRANGAEATPAALRAHLGARLPAYMLPAVFVSIDALPLNPNGKVDRGALPEPDAPNPGAGTYLAPRTPTEQVLAVIWAEVLGVERVGLEDDFFVLGGHSLLAARLIGAVDTAIGVGLPLAAVFDAPTLRGFASRAEEALRTGRGVSRPPLEPIPRKGELPLSFAEERLWFLERLWPASPGYVMPAAVRLEGPLDQEALRRSVNALVERHEVLRSRFPGVRGRPVRVVDTSVALDWWHVNLAALTPTSREAELLRLAGIEAARPFDIERGPLIRVGLLRVDEADHLLLISLHHIVSDGWSMGVLTRELSELYTAYATGREPHLPPLRVQYADYACWQRALLSQKELEGQLAWWSSHLTGLTPGAELAPDRARPALPTFAGSHFITTIDPVVSAGVRVLARAERATAFMVLLSVWKAVLRHHVRSDRVVVGTDVAGRPDEVMNLVGLFVNQLVLVTDLSGHPTLRQLLSRVRQTTLGAYAHADVPFNLLVQSVNPIRDPSRNPLFQIMFVFDNTPERELHLAGLDARISDFHLIGAPFDLSVLVTEMEDGFRCMWRYSPDLFDRSTIERLAEHFTLAATMAATEPDIPLETLHRRFQEADRTRRKAVLKQLHEARTLRFGQMAALRTEHAEGSESATE
jgi:amino acid adenylation domain-containing protein